MSSRENRIDRDTRPSAWTSANVLKLVAVVVATCVSVPAAACREVAEEEGQQLPPQCGVGAPNLCRRPRAKVEILRHLTTSPEVRSALLEGAVRGLCAEGGGDPATAWSLCAVYEQDHVLIATSAGPTGSVGVVDGNRLWRFPMDLPVRYVLEARTDPGAFDVEVLSADGERLGDIGVTSSKP